MRLNIWNMIEKRRIKICYKTVYSVLIDLSLQGNDTDGDDLGTNKRSEQRMQKPTSWWTSEFVT